MSRVVLILMFASVVFSFAQPKPFGLELGKSSREDALEIIKKEGARVTKNGYRVIKGDIVNPEIEGMVVEGLPLKDLTEATFWFYKGRLFQIVYTFPLNMNKEQFYILYEKLKTKYGRPDRYTAPRLANGQVIWKFGSVKVELYAPWVSWTMTLSYTHVPLYAEAELSDRKVIRKEASKPSRGL